MYRLTVRDKKLHWLDDSSTYNTIETEHHYNCESIEQLTGLLQFMVATSDNELDCTIARKEVPEDD